MPSDLAFDMLNAIFRYEGWMGFGIEQVEGLTLKFEIHTCRGWTGCNTTFCVRKQLVVQRINNWGGKCKCSLYNAYVAFVLY